jgi:hypothetical protein
MAAARGILAFVYFPVLGLLLAVTQKLGVDSGLGESSRAGGWAGDIDDSAAALPTQLSAAGRRAKGMTDESQLQVTLYYVSRG